MNLRSISNDQFCELIFKNLHNICLYEFDRFNIRYETRSHNDFKNHRCIGSDEDHKITNLLNNLYFIPKITSFNIGFSISRLDDLNLIYNSFSKIVANILHIISSSNTRVIDIGLNVKEKPQFVICSDLNEGVKMQFVYEIEIKECSNMRSQERIYTVYDDYIDHHSPGDIVDITSELLKFNTKLTLFDLMYNYIDVYLDELPPCVEEYNLNKRQRTD